MPESTLEPGDVIQLHPQRTPYGPLLAIIDEVKTWGVTCYIMVPTERDHVPSLMFLRVGTDDFVFIGKPEWTVDTTEYLLAMARDVPAEGS